MRHWCEQTPGEIRREVHFGRVLRCFTDRPRSVWQMFAASAAAHAPRPALIDAAGSVSYRELSDRAVRLAGGLVAAGLAPGARVALLMGNRRAFVEIWLACQRAGLVTVPLNPRQPGPEIAYACAQCGAAAIVCDAALAGQVPDDLPVAHRWAIGDAGTDPLFAAPAPEAPVDETATAVVLYTSGTTGRPKGAMLTHLGIVHSALHFAHSMQMQPGDCSLLAVPASHVTGLIANIATALVRGAAIAILPEFRAGPCLAFMAATGVTHTLIVPAMYALFLREDGFGDHDLSAWRIGGYGGAPMPEATIAEMARRAPHVGLMNGYGATEATSPTVMNPASAALSHSDCVGLPLHCCEIAVMDDDGLECPPGTAGEIWMRGPNVIPGYWDNAEANAANFTEGWWKSGDIGAMTGDGFLQVFDRKKDMLIRGGYKIYSIEVESTLSFHPNIHESAVIATPCPVLGERVHLVVVPRDAPPSDALAEDIRAFAAARLSDYKVPETVSFRTDPLPRNPNGKILKTALRETGP